MPVLYLAALLLALVAGLLATNRAGYLRRNFIYLVLPINAAADVLMEIVHLGALNSGQIRGVLMMLFVGAMLPRLRIARPTIPVFVWLLYLLPLIFLSSNLPGTLAVYSKMALAYMMLPIAYVMIRDEESFRKLLMSLAVAAYVFVAGIVVFQLFKLGVQVYKEGSLYTFGRGQAKFTKVLAYAVVLFPLLMHMARPLRYKALHVAGHVLAFLVVLVTFHRSSIIAVALGYAVLIVVGFERTRLVKSALVGLLIGFSLLVFVAPSYYDTLMAMYERRATFETELEAEAGRFTETEYVIDAMLEGSIVNVLFGRELFNGGEVMGWTKSDGALRFGRRRPHPVPAGVRAGRAQPVAEPALSAARPNTHEPCRQLLRPAGGQPGGVGVEPDVGHHVSERGLPDARRHARAGGGRAGPCSSRCPSRRGRTPHRNRRSGPRLRLAP
jgi:hypothetical protein